MAKQSRARSTTDKLLAKLRQLLQDERSTAKKLYRIGQIVERLHPRSVEHGKRRHGDHALEELATKVGLNSPSCLYQARQFANVYRDSPPKEIDHLTWAHLNLLATVDDAPLRRRLERQCVKNKLSLKKLQDEKNRLCKKRSHGGRKCSSAEKLGGYGSVTRLLEYSRRWLEHGQELLDALPELLKKRRNTKGRLAELLALRPAIAAKLERFVRAAEALESQLRKPARRKPSSKGMARKVQRSRAQPLGLTGPFRE